MKDLSKKKVYIIDYNVYNIKCKYEENFDKENKKCLV